MVQGIGGSLPLRMPQELALPTPAASGAGASGAPAGEAAGFGSTLKQFLGEVNGLQLRSDETFQSFVRGEVTDLHQVVLAQQEAGIALRLVSEMRDKLIGAYQEIMRMPM